MLKIIYCFHWLFVGVSSPAIVENLCSLTFKFVVLIFVNGCSWYIWLSWSTNFFRGMMISTKTTKVDFQPIKLNCFPFCSIRVHPWFFVGSCFSISSCFCAMFCRSLIVLFILIIALSVRLRFTACTWSVVLSEYSGFFHY